MKETITLYNHFHYGDVFLARMLIKGLTEKFNIKFHHKLNIGLFDDLDNVEEIGSVPSDFSLHQTNLDKKIINTWIGQNHMSYINKPNSRGCTFENYYNLIQDVLTFYDIPVKRKQDYLPTINYENLKEFNEIKNIFLNLKKLFKKCVLISNGKVLSGQSMNFDFTPIIEILSKKFPDILFLTTEETNLNRGNVKCTSDITNRIPDLLYIGYFSTESDLCVGRASGPYTYFMTYENVFNKEKKIISFNHNRDEGLFYKNHSFDFIWSNNFNLQNIYSIIESTITSIY